MTWLDGDRLSSAMSPVSVRQRCWQLARLLPIGELSPTDVATYAPEQCSPACPNAIRARALRCNCASACASKYSQVPARLDLAPYGRVAIVTFTADQPNSGLSAMATQRFAEVLLASQTGVELLELGVADSSLRTLAERGDGTALAQALGRDKDVPAVFIGQIKMSGVKPRGHLDASGVNMNASVSAELTVRLLSTRTGAPCGARARSQTEPLGGWISADGCPRWQFGTRRRRTVKS